MSYRANRAALEYASPLKFATQFSYYTDHPPEALEADGYWNGCHERLLNPGDEIRVHCRMDDGSWKKAVLEVCTASRAAVVVELIGEWRHGGKQTPKGMKPVHKGYGKWDVVDESAAVLARGLTKNAARAMCGLPVEDEAEAA